MILIVTATDLAEFLMRVKNGEEPQDVINDVFDNSVLISKDEEPSVQTDEWPVI